MSTTERATNVTAATVGGQAAANHLAPHLLPLEEGQWAVWRLTGLRGAGFPAAEVLKLAAPELAAAADALTGAEVEERGAEQAALAALNAALDALRHGGLWEDKQRRAPLVEALRQLKAGRTVEPAGGDGGDVLAAALRRHAHLRAERESLSAGVRRAYESATVELSRAVCEAAAAPRFREAVTWQNRRAWHSSIARLARAPASARNSRRRQNEELVANYLQRYCVKNDTIGFFGPVGWARFAEGGPAIEAQPGPDVLAARGVFFEGWCIDALADVLARDGSLRPWLTPRRLPFVGVDGGVMTLPGGASLKLPAKDAAVLAACDGRRTAREVAAGLLAAGVDGLKSEDEVFRLLDTYCKRGVLAWTLEVPVRRRAELTLRGLLEGVGDERLRRDGLGALGQLEAARDRVADAAGDPERLDRELGRLEETFCRLTGVPATRGAGQTYAARTLVYEDCRRDISVELGPEVLAALAPPLSLLLQSARWMTHELAGMYRAAFRAVHAELAAKAHSPVVSATDFWIKCDPLFFKDGTRIADRIVEPFQRRWADALALPPGARRVEMSYEELRPRVERAFDAPGPGWSHTRYNSPDVMIAAEGPEAIRRGEFDLVVGEVHLGVNCLNGALFLGQHPRPEEVHEAITADFQTPRVIPVPPKSWPTLTARTNFEFVSPVNYRLLVSPDACGVAPRQALPISDLVVEDRGGELLLRTRDGRLSFEVVEGFGEFLSSLVINFFHPLPPLEHAPRVTVGRLTITRESWHFAPAALGFAFETDEAARFVAARRWMREHGLPRFLFAKSPVEHKPVYVDLDSPILLNIFSRIVRRTAEDGGAGAGVTVSEMFPAHGQLWLPDAAGRRYTSELRMVTLDLSTAAAKEGA